MDFFQRVFLTLESTYYGTLILILTELFAIVIGILKVRNQPMGKLIIGYILYDLFIIIVYYPLRHFVIGRPGISYFIYFSNISVSVVELYVYYTFFGKAFGDAKLLRLFKAVFIGFVALTLVFAASSPYLPLRQFRYFAYILSAVEYWLLVPPCLLFIYKVFLTPLTINPFSMPSVWITLGILFYTVFSIPFYFLDRFLSSQSGYALLVFLFFYVPFSINMLFLARAFNMKRSLTSPPF